MRSRSRRWLARAGLCAASACLALALSECTHRLWLRARGTPYDVGEAELALARAASPLAEFAPTASEGDPNDPLPLLHPYTGSEGLHDTGDVLARFRAGFTEHDYVVVLVGGSVAWGMGNNTAGVLKARLEADPRFAGRQVVLLNYAHHTYKEPQQLMRIAYLLSIGYRPDAVINLDGVNELSLAYENWTRGTYPLYPHALLWEKPLAAVRASAGDLDLLAESWTLRREAERIAERSRAWNLCASSLCYRWMSGRLAWLNEERAALFERHAPLESDARRFRRERLGPDSPRSPEEALGLCVEAWYQSSLSIDALCTARGAQYLHVLQPSLYDAGSKRLSEHERALAESPRDPGWAESLRNGYPLLRERGKRLTERRVHFFDASGVFRDVETDLYFDHCHFKKSGQELAMAEIAAAFLSAR
jgi:hypothetical protein